MSSDMAVAVNEKAKAGRVLENLHGAKVGGRKERNLQVGATADKKLRGSTAGWGSWGTWS